jgi:CheY-like chemotaxis protein
MVMADAPRLQQAVLGVLNNAVKFTPSGGAITVRLESGHARARLSISDTGEGIPPERLPHIFDRNRAPDVSTTRAHAGLGRGLAIVRRLVELHGGSVRAESAGIRRGATFIIELPLSPPEARTAEAPAPPARELGTARLDGFRVLVVDDHADTRDLMSVILGKQGATVNAVGSVAEAHRLVGTFAPDVVLCDISMPGEDGFRLLEWVKEDERRQSRPIPVVAITAHAGPDDRRRVLAAGFKEYLPKPLELSDVTRVILRVAGRSRRA